MKPIDLQSTKERLWRQLDIPRETAAALGRETVEIMRAGYYLSPAGKRVEIQADLARAVAGTVTYGPQSRLPAPSNPGATTRIEVLNTTTFAAVQRLMSLGYAPAALNFASATSPGGGFLSEARAQEEALARSSTLWACLNGNPMYAYHNAHPDPFYTDTVIYSPEVLVLRDDDGALLETPYATAILTSAAVHANTVRQYLPGQEDEIGGVMWQRILKVLAVAVKHKHRAILLGSLGLRGVWQ